MRWHIGLMTGTVLDGNIDDAFLRTDGKLIEEFGYYNLMPYDEEVKDLLIKAINEAQIWNFNGPEPEIFSKTEAVLTNTQAAAVQKCIRLSGIDKNEIRSVGFHGQTVLHKAPSKLSKGKTAIDLSSSSFIDKAEPPYVPISIPANTPKARKTFLFCRYCNRQHRRLGCTRV